MAHVESGLAQTRVMGLPRLFTVESEYTLAATRPERDFVRALVDDLSAGRLTWSLAWIEEITARFEPGEHE